MNSEACQVDVVHYTIIFEKITETLGEELDQNKIKIFVNEDPKKSNLPFMVYLLKFWLFQSSLAFENKQKLVKVFAHYFHMRINSGKNQVFRVVSFIEELLCKQKNVNEQARLLAEDLINLISNPELLEDEQTDMNTVD